MLRKPIGTYQVGIHPMDTDYFGTNEFERKLSLLFFFPTENGTKECPYMDATYQKTVEKSEQSENGVKTFCYEDATLFSGKESYPVILYNHGLMGHQMESTVLCADLASNGYIVVSIGHPYGSAAVTYEDGKLFRPFNDYKMEKNNLSPLGDLWNKDISHTIDFLTKVNDGTVFSMFSGKMNLERGVASLGVSFGGCCSIASALCEKRIYAAVNLDGGLFTQLNPVYKDKPMLILCSPMNYKAHARLKMLGCFNYEVHKIKKVTHWEFSDGIYFSEKGKSNREWADRISMQRAKDSISFLSAKCQENTDIKCFEEKSK